MTERTWGYWELVGRWYGDVAIPVTERAPPIRAIQDLLSRLVPLLADMHRPRRMSVSWGEYDDARQEVAFHELEDSDVSTWDGFLASIARLPDRSSHEVAVSTLFLDLDTRIVENGGDFWSEDSASLQVTIPPPDETAPEAFQVGYDTMIDVWLPTTYGASGVRSNRAAAAANLPRLQAFLRSLGSLTGGAVVAEQSKRYAGAVTGTGFQDLDAEKRGLR